MRSWLAACALLSALLSAGCGAEPPPAKPFDLMVLSDTHVTTLESEAALRLDAIVKRVNAGEFPDVELMLVSGDVVDYEHESYPPPVPEAPYIRNAVTIFDRLEVPYYLAIGNHDYKFSEELRAEEPETLQQMAEVWRAETGRDTYYAFEHGGFRFIALDNFRGRYLEGNDYFDDQQLDWLDEQLEGDTPTILFFHYPIETDTDLPWTLDQSNVIWQEGNRFFDVARAHLDKIKVIFVGHGHLWMRDRLFDGPLVYETGGLGTPIFSRENYHLVSCDPASGEVDVRPGADAIYVE